MRLLLAVALAFAGVVPAVAQEPPIRIWGPAAMRGLVEHWTAAYERLHPEARFEVTLRGSDTAIPGLYGGKADIALMGRPNDAVDDAGFSRPLGYGVTRIEVANGARSAAGKADAIAVLVHEDNPLSGLSLAQLARAIDCGGVVSPARTWGDLGAGGSRAHRPIHIYGYDFATRTGAFIEHVVTADQRKLCWKRIAEFVDAKRLDGTALTAAERVGDAARRDPDALGFANAGEAHDGVKLLTILGADGESTLPTADAIVARRYPLARRVYAFVNRRPDSPADARVDGFLAWVVSRDGQAAVRQEGDFLPLDQRTAQAQLAIIERRR